MHNGMIHNTALFDKEILLINLVTSYNLPIDALGPVGLRKEFHACPKGVFQLQVDIRWNVDALLNKNIAGESKVNRWVVVQSQHVLVVQLDRKIRSQVQTPPDLLLCFRTCCHHNLAKGYRQAVRRKNLEEQNN